MVNFFIVARRFMEKLTAKDRILFVIHGFKINQKTFIKKISLPVSKQRDL